MLKKMLLLLVLVLFTACGTKQVETGKPVKRTQMPLWRLIMYKEPGNNEIRHEDEWYLYTVDLEQVVKTAQSFTNRIYGECSFQGATFTVVDKELHKVVKEVHVEQRPCNRCHNR